MKLLTYYADPMCSWCWGFAPQLDLIAAHFGPRLPIVPVMGGLRPGTRGPMPPELKATIRNSWIRVGQMTGQPFDFRFFERTDFVYDTEPACRAVIAARELDQQSALPVLRAIQTAFYANGLDVTQTGTLTTLAQNAGLDPHKFRDTFQSPATALATANDFLAGPRLGVTSFPTLLAEAPGHPPILVTSGYSKMDRLIPALEDWLSGRDGS